MAPLSLTKPVRCVANVQATIRTRPAVTSVARSAQATAVQPENVPHKKVSIVQLGCPKNTVDGEVLLGDLYKSGFDITEDYETADCILVNTCSFIEDAKSESLDVHRHFGAQAIIEAGQLKESGKVQKLVVTGCLAQRYSEALAEQLPEADLVVGFEKYRALPSMLQGLLDMKPSTSGRSLPHYSRTQVGEATVPFRPEWDRHRLTPRHTAYLRVAEGCNHACTFCAIPGFRGKFRSKPWQAVVEEAQHLVASGVKELNLIAEDTNQYGQDRRDGTNLAHLLKELGKLEGLQWIRMLYAYPSYFTDELVDEIATNPKVCKYIDMPLQHISNMVLLGMARPARAHTEALLHKLRDRIPGLALRTTFIAGFPGETEEQFEELMEFSRMFKFERMGCFAYSEEEGTPAASLPEQVDQSERERRRDRLIAQQQETGHQVALTLVGKQLEVLVDGYDEDGQLLGRTQWDAPDIDSVVFLSPPREPSVPKLEVGQIRTCVVDAASIFDLEAHPVA